MVGLALLGGARNPVMGIRDRGASPELPALGTSASCAWLRGRSGSDQPRWREAGGSGGCGLVVAVRFLLGDRRVFTVACRLVLCRQCADGRHLHRPCSSRRRSSNPAGTRQTVATERSAPGVPAPAADGQLFSFSLQRCLLTQTTGHGGPGPQHAIWHEASTWRTCTTCGMSGLPCPTAVAIAW